MGICLIYKWFVRYFLEIYLDIYHIDDLHIINKVYISKDNKISSSYISKLS
ncbi:hypothetical protein MUGA111182_16280 [Mucilaginibacter galii]